MRDVGRLSFLIFVALGIAFFGLLFFPAPASAARLWSSGCELQTMGDTSINGNEVEMPQFGSGTAPSVSTTIKHSGLASCRLNNTSGYEGFYHTFSSSDSSSSFYMRFYVYFSKAPSSVNQFVGIAGSADDEAAVGIGTDMKLRYYGDDLTTVVSTGNSTLATGQWYRIEWNYQAGAVSEVKVDGTQVFYVATNDGEGVSLFEYGTFGVDFGSVNADVYFDDFAFNDTNGSSQISWPGAGNIVHMQPDAAGDNSGCAAGSWSSVSEVIPDDGTSICTLTTDGGGDILDANVESPQSAGLSPLKRITLVQVGVRETAASAAQEGWQLRLKSASGGTITSGTATTHDDTTYRTNGDADPRNYTLTSFADPTTGRPWTVSGPNSLENMQIGITSTDGNPDIRVTTLWALVEYVDSQAAIKPANNLGLVGYWPMNEATSTHAGDFSGNGNTGTLTGATGLPLWSQGKLGGAVLFDGTDDYVSIGNAGSGIKTISFWIKADTSASKKVIDIDGTDQIELNSSSQVTATSFPAATVYVDGSTASAVVDTGWHFVTITDSTGVAATTLELGRVSTSYFPGKLDDVRIYSRELTVAEIIGLYQRGASRYSNSSKTLQTGSTLTSGLVGLWTLNGSDTRWTSDTAGVTYDSSGNNNTGTLTSMTKANSPVIGKLGSALSFDGSTQYVNVANSSSLRPTSVSVAAWFKPSATLSSRAAVVEKWYDGTWGYGLEAYTDNCNGDAYNAILFTYRDASDTGDQCVSSGVTASPGTWYHAVATFDNTTRVARIYVNGELKATQDNPGSADLDQPNSKFGIGASEDNGSWDHFFTGAIDEARVYNRALTPSEAKQLYQLGVAKFKP